MYIFFNLSPASQKTVSISHHPRKWPQMQFPVTLFWSHLAPPNSTTGRKDSGTQSTNCSWECSQEIKTFFHNCFLNNIISGKIHSFDARMKKTEAAETTAGKINPWFSRLPGAKCSACSERCREMYSLLGVPSCQNAKRVLKRVFCIPHIASPGGPPLAHSPECSGGCCGRAPGIWISLLGSSLLWPRLTWQPQKQSEAAPRLRTPSLSDTLAPL